MSQKGFSRLYKNVQMRGYKALTFLCLFFLLAGNYAMAQAAPAASGGMGSLHYFLIALIVLLAIYIYYVLRRMSRMLVELGRPAFEFDTSIFRSFSENGIIVSIILALIVLVGMFFFITYGAK